MTPEVLAALEAAKAAKRPVALLTRLTDGAQHLFPGAGLPAPLAEAAAKALREDAAANVTADGAPWFIHPHNPPLRLIVVGAVHIAQALVPMAQEVGFAVTVVDPRRAWATAERFPGITLIHEWSDDAVAALAPDSRTAVVTLTHDPKLDDPGLDVALKSECFYIGALGSRRTHAKRVARLAEMGHPEASIGRIHAPVGLNIEAVTAPEIALSILAEVVAARRGAALARHCRRRMIFGPTPLEEARGAILAHTIRLTGKVLKKGTVLDQPAIAALQAGGHGSVIAARMEPGDVPEDEAADRLANALMGPLLARSRASTGRVNLIADAAGLLVVNPVTIDRLNALDESLTVATLASYVPVSAKEMVATIKVIPFSVPGPVLQVAELQARQGSAAGRPALALHPFRPLKVGLVLTELPGIKESVMEGAVEATRNRVEGLCGTLLPHERVRHETPAVADALNRLKRAGAQVLLVAGASAVVDRRDVGPAAIVRAGGTIDHFGMPVDPGNLICLGHIDAIPALVLPGCAKSPKLNGIDWVLQRLFAGLAVTPRDVMAMGVGGLLKEIEARPLPREQAANQPAPAQAPRRGRRIAALVLAAGRSRRMAPLNKLLVQDDQGVPMVVRVVDNALASRARPVVVVTGYEHERVEQALSGRPVILSHAEDYAEGLSASLKAGLAALPKDLDAVVICLGDMPLVAGPMIDRLMAAFDPEEGRSIVMPTFRGKQGNPMLWAMEYLPEMMTITGDVGARHLAGKHAEKVAEVEMADDAVLRDFDTTDALRKAPGFAGVR